MKIRTLCVLSCLAGMLVPLAAVAQTGSGPQITKATITVPGKDLVFNEPDYTIPQNALGGFQIGVKLPQKGITASNCPPDGSLILQMGSVHPVMTGNNPFAAKDPALVKRQISYYQGLLADKKENKKVSILIQGGQSDLQRRANATLYAPNCMVAISELNK